MGPPHTSYTQAYFVKKRFALARFGLLKKMNSLCRMLRKNTRFCSLQKECIKPLAREPWGVVTKIGDVFMRDASVDQP